MEERRYETFEHTADLGLYIYGQELPELFAHAAVALTDQLVETGELAGALERRVELEAGSTGELLHAWLAELLYLFHAEGWLTAAARFERLEEQRLVALLRGETLDLERHEPLPEVKAVTWHGYRLERGPEGWRATVILDL